LANTSQARKRARQAVKRRMANAGQRSMMRTYLKKTVKALDAGDRAQAEAAFRAAAPILDRMARKRLIHKNKAARHKSRLQARLRAL